MSEPRCWELLQGSDLGRVAWQSADGPKILPVTYVCDGQLLVFRTSPYGPLADLIRPADVALEVDELDRARRSGWTVLVEGRAQAVSEPADMVRLWRVDGLAPWAPGVRNVFIQVTPRRIGGRAFGDDPVPEQPA